MTIERAEYILNYFSQLMNSREKAAWQHWVTSYKMEHSNSKPEQKEARKIIYYDKGWMTKDPSVLELLSQGIDPFKITTARRISKDHPNVLKFNLCPKCGKLARTPFAKQCHHCFHRWHD
ncbi:MAG: hypothetical protein AAF466_06200 [Bacteroidota bacterium]